MIYLKTLKKKFKFQLCPKKGKIRKHSSVLDKVKRQLLFYDSIYLGVQRSQWFQNEE